MATGPAACWCIFIRDVANGTTERVADGTALSPSISGDGQYVAYESLSPQPAPHIPPDPPPSGDANGTWDIYRKDRQGGGTTLVSAALAAGAGNNMSYAAKISGNGQFVAFTSRATDLVQSDTNGLEDIFIRGSQAGATQIVSVDSSENQGNGGSSGVSDLSDDGRYIAFRSGATNLVVTDTNNIGDIFVRDVQAGTTEIASVDSTETQVMNSVADPSMSGDGRFVAFETIQGGFVPYGPCWSDIYVRDRQLGLTARASVDTAGQTAQCPLSGGQGNSLASMSGDGRQVAFYSYAYNLVPADTSGYADVFVRDMGDTDGDGVWDAFDGCPGDPQNDVDGDGVCGDLDNCPNTANPLQQNSVHPGTTVGDHCEDPEPDGVFDIGDNCPDIANGGQENADGDQLGDACETADCIAVATLWVTPPGDADCDAWTSGDEGSIGTDPGVPCDDGLGLPDWPPDFDDNKTINIVDVLAMKPVFNKSCT